MISAISVPAAQATSLPDLTDPRSGVHAVQCLVEDVEIALRNALRCRLVRRPSRRVCVSRGAEERAMDALEAAQLDATEPSVHVLVSAPGLVIRPSPSSGAIEAAHELAVSRIRTGRRLTAESVESMVHAVLPAILPYHSFRVEERSDGDAVQVIAPGDRGEPVLVAACEILRTPALERVSANMIALDLQLDALLMLRKGIDDVRLLRSGDPRIARQMRDLGRFRAPEGPVAELRDRNDVELVTCAEPAA